MGAAATCIVRFKGRAASGRALLETDALIFRGDLRLSIPYRDIRKVVASNGALEVAFSGGRAVFELGSAAQRWAEKIRHPKSVLEKLSVRPDGTAVLIGVRDARFRGELSRQKVKITSRPSAGAALIFLGISTKADLSRIAMMTRRMRSDGAIWTVAPRGSPAVREADVLAAGRAAGLVDVKVVRFSDTHTAHKFVLPLARRRRLDAGPRSLL